MGDACEMMVAAEMTLAGVPAMKVPDNWPCYDVIAQPDGDCAPQRVSVKSRTFKKGGLTFVEYKVTDTFDWLAIVLLHSGKPGDRQIFVVPKDIADARATKAGEKSKVAGARYWRQDKVAEVLEEFKDNFRLLRTGNKATQPSA